MMAVADQILATSSEDFQDRFAAILAHLVPDDRRSRLQRFEDLYDFGERNPLEQRAHAGQVLVGTRRPRRIVARHVLAMNEILDQFVLASKLAHGGQVIRGCFSSLIGHGLP